MQGLIFKILQDNNETEVLHPPKAKYFSFIVYLYVVQFIFLFGRVIFS